MRSAWHWIRQLVGHGADLGARPCLNCPKNTTTHILTPKRVVRRCVNVIPAGQPSPLYRHPANGHSNNTEKKPPDGNTGPPEYLHISHSGGRSVVLAAGLPRSSPLRPLPPPPPLPPDMNTPETETGW